MNDERRATLARLEDLELRLYRVVTKSHLRIGAGEGATDISGVGNPLIRALILNEEEKRVPYIPGSSLHGVVRSWVEKALRSEEEPLSREQMQAAWDQLEEPKRRWLLKQATADFRGLPGLGQAGEKDALTREELFQHWTVHQNICDPLLDIDKCERLVSRESAERQPKGAWWNAIQRPVPCWVCDIFGYMGQRGRVKFTHAFASREDMPVDIITRVAINRLTGAADEGKLFDLEAIPPGAEFHFFVVLENLTDTQKTYFNMGIRALNLGLASLGAHSTIGFGMVGLEKLYAAQISPRIFGLETEELVGRILRDSAYQQREGLDKAKYPEFFLALSTQRQGRPPTEAFQGLVSYQ